MFLAWLLSVAAAETTPEGTPSTTVTPSPPRERRILRTVAPPVTKTHRWELGLLAGGVTRQPLLDRYVASGLLAWHVDDHFGLTLTAGASPLLDGDDLAANRPESFDSLTVSEPRLTAHLALGPSFSPFHGRFQVRHQVVRFDVYATLAMGVAQSYSWARALNRAPDDASVEIDPHAWHPATSGTLGARLIVGRNLAFHLAATHVLYGVDDVRDVLLLQAGVALLTRDPALR